MSYANIISFVEELRDLIARNSNLTTEQLALELIGFLKELYLASNALFLCESGLTYPTLRELYRLLEKLKFEIRMNSEIASRGSNPIFIESPETKH